uniref:Uncharacterized protein n=1 Tax=Panagrolaimus davidi TaxID=227884 RepID=A0A914PHZ9_9BILA
MVARNLNCNFRYRGAFSVLFGGIGIYGCVIVFIFKLYTKSGQNYKDPSLQHRFILSFFANKRDTALGTPETPTLNMSTVAAQEDVTTAPTTVPVTNKKRVLKERASA